MIKVFIGSSKDGSCAENQMVCEYSLRKHASEPVEIIWMALTNDPTSFWYKGNWNTKNWSTPFSGLRYSIPEFCNYEGKAIYQDDDQIWLDDVAKLWNYDIAHDKIMTGKRLPSGEIRHCVSLIDNEKFGKMFRKEERKPQTKMNEHFVEIMKRATVSHTEIISNRWNNYDGEDVEDLDSLGILHLTDISTNPGVHKALERLGNQGKHWYNGPIREHPRSDVVAKFDEYYNEARYNGYDPEDYYNGSEKIEYQKQDMSKYKAKNGWH